MYLRLLTLQMNLLEHFKDIRIFVLDVDGVLTDGTVHVTEEGNLLRRMHIRDGYALQLAVKKGYEVVIISGSYSEGVRIRCERLGVSKVHMSVKDKWSVLSDYMNKEGWRTDEILYMGDDIPDLDIMQRVGLPCCPNDAVPEIQRISQYISPIKGGLGCVRDVIEKTLKIKGDWLEDTGVASTW